MHKINVYKLIIINLYQNKINEVRYCRVWLVVLKVVTQKHLNLKVMKITFIENRFNDEASFYFKIFC